MSLSRARIPLVDRPVHNAVKEHGRRAGKNHAGQHKTEQPGRRAALRCDQERAERERECKDCVRKTDQTQETRYSILTTFWIFHLRSAPSRSRAAVRIGDPWANSRRSKGHSSNCRSDARISL